MDITTMFDNAIMPDMDVFRIRIRYARDDQMYYSNAFRSKAVAISHACRMMRELESESPRPKLEMLKFMRNRFEERDLSRTGDVETYWAPHFSYTITHQLEA